jgi:NCS1 family nucleobase:cation symporter-1
MWAMPLLFFTMSILSAITAACCLAAYGDALYQPYDVVAKWGTSGVGRFCMFVGALAWALGNVTTNITANSISAANDMCSLAPKYINIRRGQIIGITIGVWGFAPWKVLNSASNFLTFMSSYSIVLAPIAALMAFDFFFTKNRKFDIYQLYSPKGIYRYVGGWNWRAYAALCCAIAPNIPGMAHAINNKLEIGNIKYVYMVSNLAGDTIALFVYYVLNRFWPAHETLLEVPVHDFEHKLDGGHSAETSGHEEDKVEGSGEKKYETDVRVVSAESL